MSIVPLSVFYRHFREVVETASRQREMACTVDCLNDPKWLKENGPKLVKESAKTNRLLQLHMAGALSPLLKAAREDDE